MCQTSETLEKCIYPKEPSTCVPSIISVIPRKECDTSTFLNYPCLIVYLITPDVTGQGRHWMLGLQIQRLLVGFPLFESSSLQEDGMVEIA